MLNEGNHLHTHTKTYIVKFHLPYEKYLELLSSDTENRLSKLAAQGHESGRMGWEWSANGYEVLCQVIKHLQNQVVMGAHLHDYNAF